MQGLSSFISAHWSFLFDLYLSGSYFLAGFVVDYSCIERRSELVKGILAVLINAGAVAMAWLSFKWMFPAVTHDLINVLLAVGAMVGSAKLVMYVVFRLAKVLRIKTGLSLASNIFMPLLAFFGTVVVLNASALGGAD